MPKYDMSIHSNPDARAWAEFFVKTRAASANPSEFGADVELMHGWFANAMMAMHDHVKGIKPCVLPDGSAVFTGALSDDQS